jgi:hypothetical protein
VVGLERFSCTEKSSGISITYLSAIYTILNFLFNEDAGVCRTVVVGVSISSGVFDGSGEAVTSGAQAQIVKVNVNKVSGKVFFNVISLRGITNGG